MLFYRALCASVCCFICESIGQIVVLIASFAERYSLDSALFYSYLLPGVVAVDHSLLFKCLSILILHSDFCFCFAFLFALEHSHEPRRVKRLVKAREIPREMQPKLILFCIPKGTPLRLLNRPLLSLISYGKTLPLLQINPPIPNAGLLT